MTRARTRRREGSVVVRRGFKNEGRSEGARGVKIEKMIEEREDD